MLIISKKQVEELIKKLADPAKLDECRDEIKRMLEIKSALLCRAECLQPCCGSFEKIEISLTSETNILQETLNALDDGNITQAVSLLTEYMDYLSNQAEREVGYG